MTSFILLQIFLDWHISGLFSGVSLVTLNEKSVISVCIWDTFAQWLITAEGIAVFGNISLCTCSSARYQLLILSNVLSVLFQTVLHIFSL